MEDEGVKITVVGAVLVVAIVVSAILLIRFLRDQPSDDGTNSQK